MYIGDDSLQPVATQARSTVYMNALHGSDTGELHGLFKSVGKAVNKVVSAPLKVATKVASKVLPDKVEKAVLAPAKLVTNLTTKSVAATTGVADKVVSPIARGIKKNPALVQAAGAVASVIPGGQPIGAALMTSGRLMQQRQLQKAEEDALKAAQAEAARQKAEFEKAQLDALKAQVAQIQAQGGQPPQGAQIITVPGGGGGGGGSVSAPRGNTALYIGAGAAALLALFAISSNRSRR